MQAESLTLSPEEALAQISQVGEPEPLQSPPKRSRQRKAQPRSQSSQESSSQQSATSGSDRPDAESPQPKRVSVKERELEEYFHYRFGPLVVLLLYLATQDMDKAAFYAPSPEECETAAPPLSRIFARIFKDRKVPTWAYTTFILSDDAVALLTVLATYLDRIGLLKQYAPLFMRMFTRGPSNAQSTRNNANVPPTNGQRPGSGGQHYPGYPDLTGTYGIGGALAAD